ncbi:sialic acid synthase isoform X1 [Odocoileus virginianus]|uniref:Sialic acid synthase isoform X1 n=1 Tax=Odocoileus virginianus TaxID=9874 RepID=A0ABM4J8B5_ODOVR
MLAFVCLLNICLFTYLFGCIRSQLLSLSERVSGLSCGMQDLLVLRSVGPIAPSSRRVSWSISLIGKPWRGRTPRSIPGGGHTGSTNATWSSAMPSTKSCRNMPRRLASSSLPLAWMRAPCLENPMDRGAWQATVRGVAKGRTRMSDFTLCRFYNQHSFILGLVNSVRDTYTGENDSKLWKGRERRARHKAEGRRRRRLSALEMAVEFLHELNVPFFKVGSGDTNNFPYLEKTAKKGRPMVISSGMQSMDTMKQVYQIVKPLNPHFCFLQCTSAYPLQPEDVNLRVISEYQKLFPDIPIGYSGHETGIAISVAAVALGAKVLERHITLDKTWKGSDHAASLEPGELAELVRSVRLVERALGSPTKQLLPCEMACNEKLGKSVVAKVKIPEGSILTLDMLTVKVGEPKGYPPEDIFSLVGKKVLVTVEEDDTIMEELIENHGKKIRS